MARRRKQIPTTSTPSTEQEEPTRIITPENGIPQDLEPRQFGQWLTGMGSAPTILQGRPPENINTPVEQDEGTSAAAARKLTFSTTGEMRKPTAVEVVQGNRSLQLGMKLDYFPPIMRYGRKIAKLVQAEVEEECQKWKSALIGYVIGGNPTFKEMLKYVYGVWNFVVTPQVFLHNDGYFIFRFMSENDKETLLQNGPFTFNNRPMVLKHWEPEFQMSKEPLQVIPIWVT
ncbi:hypothetical protein A4A49_55612, partial [Nicotiana attenuata]